MRIYKLFWDDFSGWYLEMVKPAYQQPTDKATMEATRHYFDLLMRLIHPFMPFVTEEIWQDLAPRTAGESIMYAPMPVAEQVDEIMLADFENIKEVISAIRNIRNKNNISYKHTLTVEVELDYNEHYTPEFFGIINKLANVDIVAVKKARIAINDASILVKSSQYYVNLGDQIDVEAEMKKLTDELTYLEGFLASVMKKLSNERFVSSAPEKVVANEKAKKADAEAKIAAIKERMEALK